MELNLTHDETEQHIRVLCDGQYSHTFDLQPLILPKNREEERLFRDPIGYGDMLYNALFPPGKLARQTLDTVPDRILLVAESGDFDAIPWEYVHGPDGFLVQEYRFVRGLPPERRIAPPNLEQTRLHIVAIPSNPLDASVAPLNIDAEWISLREIIKEVSKSQHCAIALERTRPPTIEQVRNAVAGKQHRVVHFMGHGRQYEHKSFLCLEQDNGNLDLVDAKRFALRVRGSAFLVTLNACMSARPDKAPLSNFAASLVHQRVPYALGMRFSIYDDDARTFTRALYNDLARGTPVEEALLQARLTLGEKSIRPRAVGVPVLYTSLASPAAGFARKDGSPAVIEHQPRMEVSSLLRAEGAFQGRIDDLKRIGKLLTGDNRPRVLTIHGGGGQGKTALAREVVERFAYAWPDGVWCTSLENLPDRAIFSNELARFLGIPTQEIGDPEEVERQVLARLATRRMLIVLDNAETLVDAVEANNKQATDLAQLLQQLPSSSVSLLITSRTLLGWSGEVAYELGGLAPQEGAQLFRQRAPSRTSAIEQAIAEELSRKIDGHPLGLRLLGGAFNTEASGVPLSTFVLQFEEQLVQAEDKYKGEEHRHRKLYACIETSVRYLNDELRHLLRDLCIFHAPFLPETAVAIFDPDTKETKDTSSPVRTHLHLLWQRGLLTREIITVRDGTLLFYYLLPTTRPYVEHHLTFTTPQDALYTRFGEQYARIVRHIYDELDRSAAVVTLAQRTEADLECGAEYVTGIEQGYYLTDLAWVLSRLGAPRRSLQLHERALLLAEGQEQQLKTHVLNNMAGVYQVIGQPQRALSLYEQALPIMREVENWSGEAAALNNVAGVYETVGQPQRALSLYEQALPIMREVGNRSGEAATLNNMALIYQKIGQPQRALSLYEQALPIMREVGDRSGEAITLNNMAEVYRATGQPQRALSLHEQILPIRREVGDHYGEATTLNNMALGYRVIGQPQRALSLYEQALPIRRKIGDRPGEAATLNNMALIYQKIGQPQRALSLYEQALPIRQEVGDRSGEATTLNGMAAVYWTIGQYRRALSLLEQALPIRREVEDRSGEATTLNNLAHLYQQAGHYSDAEMTFTRSIQLAQLINNPASEAAGYVGLSILLYEHLQRPTEAIRYMEQAIEVLARTGLPQSAAGDTPEQLQSLLQVMRRGTPLSIPTSNSATMPIETIRRIATNTIAVITDAQEHRDEWRETVEGMQQNAQSQGPDWQIEVDFFTAIMAILDGQTPTLPDDHPYAQALRAILEGIAASGAQGHAEQ